MTRVISIADMVWIRGSRIPEYGCATRVTFAARNGERATTSAIARLSLMTFGGLQTSRNSSTPRPALIVDGTDAFGTRTDHRA